MLKAGIHPKIVSERLQASAAAALDALLALPTSQPVVEVR
jgi:hypothetical protein